MSGSRDLAAAEAAELQALRREAARKREELGESIEALRTQLKQSSLRRWAVLGAEWAAGRAWHSALHAVRHAVPANGTSAHGTPAQGTTGHGTVANGRAANGRAAVTARARRLGHGRAGKAAVIATPAGLAALAGAGWLAHRHQAASHHHAPGPLRGPALPLPGPALPLARRFLARTGRPLAGRRLTLRVPDHRPLTRRARAHLPLTRQPLSRRVLTRLPLTRRALTHRALTRRPVAHRALTRRLLTRR